MAWLLRYLLCCIVVKGLEVAQYYGSSGFSCPLAGSGEDSDATVEVSRQWPTGEDIVPRCLLPDDADTEDSASLAPQILDFYPKIGIAGEVVLVEIFGRRFPHILPQENNSVVECTLGGDGYRAPAVLLSDKRALCNVTSPVATSSKLGLIFANVLQAYAKKKLTFGRVAAPTLQVTPVLAEDESEECKDTQVFCQPPPPEPAFTTVPFQRSFDPQPISVQSTTDDVDKLYSIWEVVSVVPDTLPLNDSAYTITFAVPPKNGLACRLFPDGVQVFASRLSNYSIMCPTVIGAPGSYALQIGEAPDFNFLTLPLMIEVFEQPTLLHVSPAQVYPGQGWTLYLLASKFPEQRMTVASFRCKVGEQQIVGEVSTSRVASCTLTEADVEIIGPGTHAVEVLIDGLHESRSEPRVMLKILPEKAQVEALSGDAMTPLPRGQPLIVTGQRLPVDAGCIFGEDVLSQGIVAAFAAATYHNDSTISCTVPQEATLGVQRFRLAAAGQELSVQTTSKMSLTIVDRPAHQDIQADAACAGGTCQISRRYLPNASYFRMNGLDLWPAGYAQQLPSLLPELGAKISFAPSVAFAEQVPLRFGAPGLFNSARLFPSNFFCEVETLRFAATFVREESWPFLCHVDLSSYKGLQVRAQLLFINGEIEERIGPAFNVTLLLRPRVLEVSPRQALLGLATPLALHLAVAPPEGAMLRCDFGRYGTSVAWAVGTSVHCRSPMLEAMESFVTTQLKLMFILEESNLNLTQRMSVVAQEDFRFEVPPMKPVIEALPNFSAAVGQYVFLEWKSHAPIFEVLARVPYHCSWRGTEIGDLSTPVLALSPSFGRCRVPVASVPHSAAVRLEDPSGQVVVDGPLFSYYSPVLNLWWFQEDEPTASALSESAAWDRMDDLLSNVPSPAPEMGPPTFDPELLPMGLGVVPLETLEPNRMLIVVKAFSPSRGSVRGGTTVRLTILVPEDSEEPYALWCVFGDHPPFAAIRPDLAGRTWHDKLEAERLGSSTSPWMDLLCISPEHPVPEAVPVYITRSPEYQPGNAPDGSQMFTYTPHPDLVTITPALITHHFQMDQQVTIHLRADRGQMMELGKINEDLDCALLALDTATSTGDWPCMSETNISCPNKTVGDIYDALGSMASGMKISGYAATTQGILSKGSEVADGNGLLAVTCQIPTQFTPSPTASQDVAADPIPSRAAVKKSGWQATEYHAPLWLEPGQFPVDVDLGITEPAWGDPYETHFDMKMRFAVSFNGPDGDYYTSGVVSSTPFKLPYAIQREYGWAEGGAAVRLLGVTWPEDADLELQLIFVFSERLVPSDCVRISSNTAECIVPTPSAGTSNVTLQMKTMRNGEVAMYDLPHLTYTYIDVPMLSRAFPQRAPVTGGRILELTGGPFDARVEYYCAFLPALVESAPHLPVIGAEPARYLNGSTLLCESPKVLLPTVCTLALSSDRMLTNLGLGHLTFEFYYEGPEEKPSEYQLPTLESENVVPIITALVPLKGQEGLNSSVAIHGDGFVAGCQCAFIHEDPEMWDADHTFFSNTTVLSNTLMHCAAPDESAAVAVYCPPVLSSNYMWIHRPEEPYKSDWPRHLLYTHMYSEYNLTYRPGVRIQHIWPRAYIPYVESQSEQKYFVYLNLVGFEPEPCEVRFGDVPAVTMVMNASSMEAIIPAATSNSTVPINIFCGEEQLQQVTFKQTLMFTYTFLPEVHSVDPQEVEAQSHEWVTLYGRYFEDQPGRACLIGGALVELSAVRVMSSEMVQCRVPVWQQDVQNLSVAFSNDGLYFSKGSVALTTWVRIRVLAVEPSFVYIAESTNITILGRNFIPGVQCLFNDYARVEPVVLHHTQLHCILPTAFMKLGIGNVSVRVVMRPDRVRESKYFLEEREFSLALRERPPEPIVKPMDLVSTILRHMDPDFRRFMGHVPNGSEPEILNRTDEVLRLGEFWWPSTYSDGSQPSSFTRISISPQRGPLDGLDVILRTDGFYIPPYSRCRCQFGSIQVPAYCIAQLQQVQCRAPAVTGEQAVMARFSINDGATWGPDVAFAYYAPPLFAALQPPLGSLLGVNNVSIYMFQIPDSNLVPSYCRWQGTFVSPIYPGGTDHIICPVPAHSKFAPFSQQGDDMPLSLEVSFAGIPPVWIPLPRSLNFRQHNVPVRETQELFVAPRHGVAIKGGADLTLTGSGFVYPAVNKSLVGCIFGKWYFSPGEVISDTEMRCRAPLLFDVFPDAEPPMDVIIDLTFDGGQTSTNLNNVYSYLKDFQFESVLPSGGLYSTQTLATLQGRNFKRTPNIFLKFGDIKVSAALATAESLRTLAPQQQEPGTYTIYYSVDDQTFVDTGLVWVASATSLVTAIIPDRGFRVGGTNVTIVTSGLYWLPTLTCVFGYAPVSTVPVYNPDDPLNPRLTCLTPPCEQAMYLDGVGPNSSVDCFGFVTVQMTFNGRNMFGNLTYEYVKMPQVTYASPFPASGWSNDLTIALFGMNFQEPMWCRWANLAESPATDVTPGFMRCTAPELPIEQRPDNSSTIDSILSYFEISPNGQDWTRFKRAWLWYREPEVLDIVPNTTFRSYAPQGDFIVTGRYFRLLQPELIQCVWLYDKYLPPERVTAELLSPETLRCQPTQPAAPSGIDTIDKLQPLGVNLEVSMSTQVDSASGLTVLAEERMQLEASAEGNYPGAAVSPGTCLVTGGCTLTLRGLRLWAEDATYGSGNRTGAKLFVAVGDHLLEARRGKDPNWATVRLPPTPHMAVVPRAEPLRLTRNLQDYTPADINIGFNPIPIGTYYRAELHNGTLQPCPQGHACPGVGVNQSDLTYPGDAPIRCLPGTWMNATGYFECEKCPEGVYCPRYAMIEPEHCETGYICWGGTEFDANLAICPAGSLCIRPPYGKTPSSSTSRFPFVRRLKMEEEEDEATTTSASERRLRLATLPSTVEVQACPAGFFCPPGSIAQMDPFTGELIYVSPMACTRLGIVCSEGSFNPLSIDVIAGPGEYVATDGSGVLPCPVGMSCPGGPGFLLPSPCPPGQYQLSSGAPACSTCTAGTICPGFGSALPTLCPAGRVCAHAGREIPSYLCPAGSYCPPGVITLNTLAGLASGGPAICPPGLYCMAGTSSVIPDPTSMTTAKQCTQGTFCVANTTTAGGTDNCPPRWYCPAGVSSPQPTPPGHYVGQSGSIYPSKCRPGTYAANWLMIECEPCPAGTECPLDGTVVPTVCRPGSYREATANGADPTKNVMCTPCPQGTWSERGGITSVLDCKNCDERYVCPMEGTIRFATVDQPCAPGAAPTEICYENSQGWDCPQGYGCGPATTSFTQYDYFCEPGFWCKVRTVPSETRNLVCPAGYYCKRETGESGGSGRKAFRCTSNRFCPEGTAAEDVRIDNQLLIVLENVQSLVSIVTQPDLTRGSMCRICSEDLPPGVFDLPSCKPCGKVVPLSFFENLATVNSGSRRLDDLDLDANFVALHENYSNVSRGKQVWILPAQNFTEEPVILEDIFADEQTVEIFRRVMEERVPRELQYEVPSALANMDLPNVVGYFAETTGSTESAWARNLQTVQAVDNMTNSSNETEIVYQCAPDITTLELTPWTKSSGKPCYTAVEEWKGNLKCPRGTISTAGSESPEDCIQQGELIAVTNIYKCYPPRPCTTDFPPDYVCEESEVLCNISGGEPLELYAADKTYKKSFVWGEKIDPSDPESKTVQFYGYDPFVDEDLINKRPFHNFQLQPMDIAVLDLAFDKISPTTLINAGESGHFNIHIHSTLLDPNNPEVIARGHLLPPYFGRSINTRLHVQTQLKILALEQFNMSVQLDLLHGGHVQNLDTFNQVLDIHRYGPSRAVWGQRDFFCAVISKERLLNGARELPYNMPPGMASAVGDPGFAIALTKLGGNLENQPQTVEFDGDNALAAVDKGGQAFWQSQGLDTVPMPWLPFFSNCVGFDSYIILWDLFESPHELREGCEMIPKDEVMIVPPLIVDMETLEPRFDPIADSCEFITKCHFEENMNPEFYGSELWWELGEEDVLFYITTYPITYKEYSEGDPFFAPRVGTELLTGVNLAAEDRPPEGGRIPRRVYFQMSYFQESREQKKLVNSDLVLSEFDEDTTDTVYYLMLKFEALGWQDLMNEFQLPYHVYGILYCLIGLGAVGATLVAWAGIRLKVRKANAPPFRLLECYEFMFWWPVQGVTFATLPVVVACGIIKLLLAPEFNFTGGIPCKYSELQSAQTDEKESERCREGRTGICFLLAGLLMMASGSRLIIPRLREVEEQFLLQQPTHLLSREGLTLRAEQRQQIRTVPIRWKRAHLIFVSVFLVFPLTLLWEFTYSDFFGENALYFIIGFSFAMNFVDNALSRAVREELIQVPLSTACSVVLFVGTLGADDFVDFCEGFFLELLYGIAERLILGTLFEAIEKGLAYAAHWAKTRSWFWRMTLILTGGRSTRALLMNEGKDDEEISPEEMVQEGTPIEEAMEEVIGCGTTCMSTIMTPFIIGAIYVFAQETEIPVQYDIRSRDLVCYLLFGIIIAPFQVMMDILMNHATELQNNVRIYDYMLYSKWRWRNRVTRWLFDDPRLDQSIAEPLQSVNHLAFSPQFYFIETYYTWGMLVLLLSITVFLRKSLNPLDDPALFILVGQMFLLNYLLDRMIRWLTSSVLWKPMDNNNFRVFSRSVALALQRKDAALAQEKYRQWFWQRHSGWLVGHLNDIFTPRSRERYRGKLSLLYQQALQLQPTRVYKTPGDAFPEPVGQQELPDNLRQELEEDDSDDERSMASLALPGKGGLSLPITSKAAQGGAMRQSVALRQLDIPSLPSMPTMPIESVSPPEELEDNWPLQAHGDALELPDAAGFGPLAALTGVAWLRVARRRIIMARQAQEYTIEQPQSDVCGACAVRANDPFVKERVGVWQHGPRFKVYLTGNLRQLMNSFERHYNVPPMPFIPSQWQNWLDRHNTYQTLCVRCALERGFDPPEAATPTQTPRAIQSPQTPLTLRDKEDGASTDSEEEQALMQLEEDAGKEAKDDSDLELDPAETTRFPNLVNVQVPQAAREMIVYWARQARKRVKRRRTIRYQPDSSSEEEESDYEEEEEEEDTPSEAD